MTAHWGIDDPAAVEGGQLEKKRAFVTAFRQLRNRISIFVNLPMASLDRIALARRLVEIGQIDDAPAKV
jgi:arsenate reductase